MGKEVRIIALLALDTVFFLLEAIIGYSVHSLALIADSFHMLNDIISLFIALWAVKVKNNKPADGKYTYGWQRAEILGALINAVFLIALCFTILIEAIQRFFEPVVISSPKLVLVVGIAGLISNGVGLVLFHEHGHSHGGGSSGHGHGHSHLGDEEAEVGDGHGHSHNRSPVYESASHENSSSNIDEFFPSNVVDRYGEATPLIKKDPKKKKKRKSLNMEGVFLHVLGDALGNVGVIITALIIWKTDYSWRFLTDPIISLVITCIIFSSALPLCRKSSKILLQATPPNVNSNEIVEEITKMSSIKSIHDFHVWNLNEDILIASLHLELGENEGTDENFNKTAFIDAVKQVREILHSFGIHSATIQPEFLRASSVDETSSETQKSLARKASTYGATNKSTCAVDDVAGCDTDCLT